jgi:uncharacterized membrane protein SpoIIM required for sporulation
VNKRDFVSQRRPVWGRFARGLDRLELRSFGKLSGDGVLEFSRLFREVCHDLATVRSHGWGGQLETYLNDLAARGHNLFYRAPPGAARHFFDFVAAGYPRVFRKNFGYFLAGCLLFFVPLAITWAVVQSDPELAGRILPQEQLEQMEAMYDYDPNEGIAGGFGEERAGMGGFYVYNNVGIALRAFAAGILLGTVTAYVLLANGITIGAIAGYLIAQGKGDAFTSFVISHGSFELTAIAIAGGAGLMLGNALLHPGQRTRKEALQARGVEAVQIAAGAAVMLIVAALLEAFWSPSAISADVKYIVGGALWILVALYLLLAGRDVPNRRDVSEES